MKVLVLTGAGLSAESGRGSLNDKEGTGLVVQI